MKTKILTDFIAKYNLPSGEVEVAKWKVDDTGTLVVRFSTADQSCFGYVEVPNADIPMGEYFIADTSTLKALLTVVGEDVRVKVVNHATKDIPIAIALHGASSKATYALGDTSIATRVRNANVVPSDADVQVNITITPELVTSFLKSKGALKDVDTFTIWSSNTETEIILGYAEKINSNRVTLIPTTTKRSMVSHVSFDNRYLYDILNANKTCTTGVLQVVLPDGESPFVRVHYEAEDFKAVYIINRVHNS